MHIDSVAVYCASYTIFIDSIVIFLYDMMNVRVFVIFHKDYKHFLRDFVQIVEGLRVVAEQTKDVESVESFLCSMTEIIRTVFSMLFFGTS